MMMKNSNNDNKIALITDTHAGARNDAKYLIDHQARFYEETFFPTLLENGIKEIIHLGDFYDRRKYINFLTAYRARKVFLEKLVEYDLHMDLLVGNHDIYYKNTDEVSSLKELMTAFSDNVTVIEQPAIKRFNGVDIGLMPWIGPYNERESYKALEYFKEAKVQILMGHFEIQGFNIGNGRASDHGMERDIFYDFADVFSGHFHTKSTIGNTKYLGSPFQFTWSDHNDTKGFYLYDPTVRQLDFITNPNSLYEVINYNDEDGNYDYWNTFDVSYLSGKIVKINVIKNTSKAVYENFLSKVDQVDTIDLKIQEDISEFYYGNVNMSDADYKTTPEMIEDYIKETDTTKEKDKLVRMMNLFYNEAVSQMSSTKDDG